MALILLSSAVNHKKKNIAQRNDVLNGATVKAEVMENMILILVMVSMIDSGNGES